MVGCSAVDCTKRSSGKKKTKGHSFYEFPCNDTARLREWIHRLGRSDDYHPTDDSRVCQDHFEDCMFPDDLQLKYTGKPRYKYKYLVEKAVPTKFLLGTDGKWQVGAPIDHSHASSVAAATQSESRRCVREGRQRRSEQRDQKRMIDELLADKAPVFPKIAKKSVNKVLSSSTTNVPVMPTAGEGRRSTNCEIWQVPKLAATAEEGIHSSTTSTYEVYPQTMYGHPGVVYKDHSYAPMMPHLNAPSRPSAPATPPHVQTDQSIITGPPAPLHAEDTGEDLSDMEASPTLTRDSDPDYTPSSSEDESEDLSNDEDEQPPNKDATYLVYDANLQHLMKRCQDCGKPIISKEKSVVGALVTYQLSCLDGHTVTWRSQPVVRQTSLGHLMLAAAILFTGLTYKRFAVAAKVMNLAIFTKGTFNVIQRTKLFPVIQEAWRKEKSELVSKRTDPISLSGDCRVDSPGHNGKYGTYSLMETSERPDGPDKILNIQLVQCTEVKNSNAMEAEGLRRGLKEAMSDGLEVDTLVTDRHVQVRKIMATEFPDVDHQFDIWHVSKAVVKKLNAKAVKKENSDLLPWIQCVSNHLWWCCATCNGDEQELRERWISILSHVTNKHRWRGSLKYKKCQHKKLTVAQCKKKAWLKSNSSSFEALQEVVMDKYLLKSLPHLVKFHHTGALEVFHNQLLKYCPKRQHFGYRGMMARMMLAGLDWNSRECHPLLSEDGSEKMDLVFSKRRKMWVLRKRYHRSSGRQNEGLVDRMLEVHKDKIQLPPIVSPKLPSNIARVEKPNKEQAMAERRTRFKDK